MSPDLPTPTVLEVLERDEAYMATIKAIGINASSWLSVKKTADFLHRSVRQIRRYEAEGKMPERKKFGRQWRYPRPELEKIKLEFDRAAPKG